jgi:hypothetical protein
MTRKLAGLVNPFTIHSEIIRVIIEMMVHSANRGMRLLELYIGEAPVSRTVQLKKVSMGEQSPASNLAALPASLPPQPGGFWAGCKSANPF